VFAFWVLLPAANTLEQTNIKNNERAKEFVVEPLPCRGRSAVFVDASSASFRATVPRNYRNVMTTNTADILLSEILVLSLSVSITCHRPVAALQSCLSRSDKVTLGIFTVVAYTKLHGVTTQNPNTSTLNVQAICYSEILTLKYQTSRRHYLKRLTNSVA
jgi:hypothetical protein